jgi:hypothetical protein
MTGDLNTASEYIHQALCEAAGLDDDKFESIHRLLTGSQNIIKFVISGLENDADIDADTDGGESE